MAIGGFPAQRASNAESVSMSWRHHGLSCLYSSVIQNTTGAVPLIAHATPSGGGPKHANRRLPSARWATSQYHVFIFSINYILDQKKRDCPITERRCDDIVETFMKIYRFLAETSAQKINVLPSDWNLTVIMVSLTRWTCEPDLITAWFTLHQGMSLLLLNNYFLFSAATNEKVGWYHTSSAAVTSTHYNDVIMSAMASQITSLTIVYSTVYWDADQRKHQSSASLAFVRGIHRWPVNSRTKDQ